jgi:uncharacterized membrane protein
MRRWLLPLLIGAIAALVGYQLALAAAPRLLMSAAVKRVGQAGMNRMTHGPLATDRSRAIVRPSPDLAYSSCPFDLSNGPVRVQVAPAPSVYWSLSVFDSRTDTALARNNGETGDQPIDIVLARPGQPTPAGREVVRVNGAKGIALVRILVQDRTSFAAIDAARRRSSCAPL